MKVSELIEKLSQYRPDDEVLIRQPLRDFWGTVEAREAKVDHTEVVWDSFRLSFKEATEDHDSCEKHRVVIL